MFAFVFKHNEQDRIAVVIAHNPARAYEKLAEALNTDESEPPNIDHTKRFWDVQSSSPVEVEAAIVDANIDASEGYTVFAEED